MDKDVEDFVSTYEHFLRIDPNDLDNAIIEHPEYYWHICRRYALTVSIRDEAKDNLKQSAADLFLTYKQDFENAGTRATEAVVNASVECDTNQMALVKEYRERCLDVSIMEGIKAAFEQRSYALKELVDMHCVNYNASESNTTPERPKINRKPYTRRAASNE